jgi:serine/threonine-protein kinase
MLRFSADLGPDAVMGTYTTVAISPDGLRIAYPVRAAGGHQLATRLMDQSSATVLAGTENADQPFFNPDGQWIGFFADGKLKKVSVQGGAAVTLCDASILRGASWGEDGTIIANLDLIHLFRVPAAGGEPQIVAKLEEKGGVSYRYPQILPGGQAVLLSQGVPGTFDDGAIAVLSLQTGAVKTVQHRAYFGRYLPSGHLVYLHEGKLFAVPFDLKRMETHGAPAPVPEDVAANPGPGTAQMDVSGATSGSGTFVYLSGKAGAALAVAWMDAAGKVTPLFSASALVTPRLSPDGKRLALSIMRDISVYDPERGATTQITFTGAGNTHPVWTPDGKHIVYNSTTGGIWWARADGSAQPEQILAAPPDSVVNRAPYSFSPDGRRLAFYSTGQGTTAQDIYILPLDMADPDHPKPGKPELFVQTPYSDLDPAFSPDGRWLAYVSAEAGNLHVYVRPYPAGMSGAKWLISTLPGRFPIWASNGRELFYESLDGRIMAVDYTAKGETFTSGKPRQWSETRILTTGTFKNLDLAPDGKRFVVIPSLEATGRDKSSVHAVFLVNFFDELKRRLP